VPADAGIRTATIHVEAGAGPLRAGEVVEASALIKDVAAGSVLAVADLRTGGRLIAAVSARFLVVPGVVAPVEKSPANRAAGDGNLAELLGVTVLAGTPDRGRLRAEALPWMANPYGIVHGGIPVALVDLGARNLGESLGEGFRAMSLDINFQRPARIGSDMIVDATARRVGARVAVIEVEITQGRVIASATVTLGRD
ncbi:MAG: PaaI family thioesterase, partial [Nocardiaceae bacterium]|nr:PaaI family thioesterase [Nocardiaceae bacterium]